MERTRLTVTDEQRKSVALEYVKVIKNGAMHLPARFVHWPRLLNLER
jgi:hypothetical protein